MRALGEKPCYICKHKLSDHLLDRACTRVDRSTCEKCVTLPSKEGTFHCHYHPNSLWTTGFGRCREGFLKGEVCRKEENV